MITYASHNHSMHSLKDSTTHPADLVKYFAEQGGKVIALTDHGTLTGIYDFMDACEQYNVVGVPGLEAYVAEENEKRLHLILLPKDIVGFHAISDALMDANLRIKKVGTSLFPEMNKEIIKKHFGEGTKGHGHVIATSACIGGVIAGVFIRNNTYKSEFEKLENQITELSYAYEGIQRNEAMKQEMLAQKAELKPLAEKKFASREKAVEKLRKKGDEGYEKALHLLEMEKQESEQAKIGLQKLSEQISAISKKLTALRKKCSSDDIRKLKKNIEKRDELKDMIFSEKDLIQYMELVAMDYERIFGKGNFYLELQYHGMPEEKKWMFVIDQIAQRTGIPTLAANDAHLVTGSKEEVYARETIRALAFNKMEPAEETDKELYLKSDEDLEHWISMVVGPTRAKIAMEGTKEALEQCHVVFSKNEKHYPIFDKNKDAIPLLQEMVKERIPLRFTKEEWTKEYQDRLDYEMQIICSMGYADYHLIVQDLIQFAKKLGKMPEDRYAYLKDHIKEMEIDEILEYVNTDQSYVGYTVGPGRGSSAGSLVCYILGITEMDPIKYDLLFERFLNPERQSMPDIDTDYANGYREVAIDYTYKRYGEDAVCRIITLGSYGAKGAVKDVASCLGKTSDPEAYDRMYKNISRVIPGKPNTKIADCMPEIKALEQDNPEITELVQRAMSVEGVYRQYGMHPAGVIIADNHRVGDYVPLAFDEESKQWKCQCDMVRAENSGLLKFDFLVLKNLNIITDCIRSIYRNHGVKIDPQTDIKEEKEVIDKIVSSGETNFVFQLEGQGIREMAQEFAPDSLEDLILVIAAYRPGPMEKIPDMIKVKKGLKKPTYITPELEPILRKTYGTTIYQEQVQQIFQKLAGYSLGRADLVRRAMSKKKEKDLLKEKPLFIEGCKKNGISEDKSTQIFDDMVDFAKYAFNKSATRS